MAVAGRPPYHCVLITAVWGQIAVDARRLDSRMDAVHCVRTVTAVTCVAGMGSTILWGDWLSESLPDGDGRQDRRDSFSDAKAGKERI